MAKMRLYEHWALLLWSVAQCSWIFYIVTNYFSIFSRKTEKGTYSIYGLDHVSGEWGRKITKNLIKPLFATLRRHFGCNFRSALLKILIKSALSRAGLLNHTHWMSERKKGWNFQQYFHSRRTCFKCKNTILFFLFVIRCRRRRFPPR